MAKIAKNQKGFSVVEGLVILMILGLLGFVGWIVYKNHHGATSSKSAMGLFMIPGHACGNQKEFFSVSPIKDTDLVSIIPLGNPNPPAHIFPTDHIYLYLRRSGPSPQPGLLGPAAQVPVVSPGDLQILTISAKEYLSGGPHHTDYEVDFAPCKEVQGRFDHLSSLSEKLLSAFNGAKGECQTSSPNSGTTIKFCRRNISLSLKAGEDVGTAGGTNGSNNLDFWLSDSRTAPLNYANPGRWKGSRDHIVCPVDYYSPPLKSKLEKLFGDSFGKQRTTPPVCGSVAEDVKGSAQGVWINPGKQIQPEDQHIALVPDNINPAQLVFSIGQSLRGIGIDPVRYRFLPADNGNVNKAFKLVRADGQVYCYETTKGGGPISNASATLLIQLPSDTSLRIGPGPDGKCGIGPWNFSSSKDFER